MKQEEYNEMRRECKFLEEEHISIGAKEKAIEKEIKRKESGDYWVKGRGWSLKI